jgi:hypothetical protein
MSDVFAKKICLFFSEGLVQVSGRSIEHDPILWMSSGDIAYQDIYRGWSMLRSRSNAQKIVNWNFKLVYILCFSLSKDEENIWNHAIDDFEKRNENLQNQVFFLFRESDNFVQEIEDLMVDRRSTPMPHIKQLPSEDH